MANSAQSIRFPWPLRSKTILKYYLRFELKLQGSYEVLCGSLGSNSKPAQDSSPILHSGVLKSGLIMDIYKIKFSGFAFPRGECFGLLGKNGAGKSSIFKMLTGETTISDGEIFTHGYSQKYQLHQIYQMIGYCPQFDALLSDLTCRETLEIFAMIRGIPFKEVRNYVEHFAQKLDFIQHIDKRIKELR